MSMLDKVLAAISIASLIGFMSIFVYYVAEVDLTIITVVVLVMAVVDFYLLTTEKPKADG
jgi:hypothetical protein